MKEQLIPLWPAVLGLLGTALGAAIAYLSAHAQTRATEHAQQRLLMLAKLEELYATAAEVRKRFDDSWTEVIQRHALAKMRAKPKEIERQEPIPFARLRMLIDLYFPELRGKYEAVLAAREPLGECIADSISRPLELDLKKLNASHKIVEAKCDELMQHAADLVPRLLAANRKERCSK